MDMTQAATFLGSSILLMIGMVVIIAGIVVINNILSKYWKPVRIFTPDSWKGFHPPYTEHDKIEPSANKQ